MITLAMSYRQWLLGTTFFCVPELIARVAVPQGLLKEINRDNKRRKQLRDSQSETSTQAI